MPKIDKKQMREVFAANRERWPIGPLQVAAYVAAGAGLIGRMYAHQPADAYRDSRAGRGPYCNRDLEQIRQTLITLAEVHGLDPHHLPDMPDIPACGVF